MNFFSKPRTVVTKTEGGTKYEIVEEPETDPLLAERGRIAGELEKLGQVDARRVEAEARLAAIDNEMGDLDRAEEAHWRAWSADPSTEAPKPQLDARRALAVKRGDATAVLDSARASVIGVQPRIAELTAELAAIEGKIFKVQLDAIVAEAAEHDRRAHELAAELQTEMGHVLALRRALATEQQIAAAANDQARIGALGETIQRVGRFSEPAFGARPGDLIKLAAEWSAKIRGGKQ